MTLDLLPRRKSLPWLRARRDERGDAALHNVLAERLPRRFAETFCDLYFDRRPLRRWTEPELQTLANALHAWPLQPSGTEGYRTAEVTLGGVDTAALSSTTLESRRVPGLHFIGEVVDVTGWLGGYNFHWAWASAVAAAEVV